MNLEQARYMVAVADFLLGLRTEGTAAKETHGLRLSNYCPECGVRADRNPMSLFGITHGVLHGIWFTTLVVIGCEGYMVVDPNRVGIPRAEWQPTYPADPPLTD